ncbi:MAG: L-asparaginase, partial [Acidobacteriota bacterium]|nr:L-asparaginase [Acidobacteriota bacterium]
LKLIESDFNEWWESIPPRTSLTVQFIDFFKNFIREKVKEPMVVVFDEMDRFEEWGYFTDDFFKAIQKLFDERHKLGISFILSAIAHPSLLLKDTITSSFKIGAHFPLPDFDCNEETVKQWIEGLKINNQGIRFDVGKEILTQTGGHPFLTSYLMHRFNEIEGKNTSEISPLINEMVQNAMNPLLGLAIFKAPRDFIVARERYAVTVLEVYKKMLKGPVNLTDIPEKVLAILYTTGLTKLVDNRFLEVRSPIFRRIFDEKWCKRTESGMGTRDWYAPMFIPSYATKDKPNICLINAGGTLGMVEHDNKIVPPQNEEEFFDVYPGLKVIADINYVPSKPKDGANIFPADWTQIARDIFDRRNDGYDGFVIIHGTDTMTYTASAVAFALGPGIKNPVVFVGSQTPYYVRYGDAMVNLARACKIASENIPEVVISFGDEVYRAVRAQKYNDYLYR